jgi:hypothetical protein
VKISHVAVERTSQHSDYCLGWQTSEARYHVWLAPENYALRAVVGRSTAQLYKHDLTPDSKCRFLSVAVPKNKAMFDDAMAEAVAGHLFEKCDEAIAQAERDRLARAAAEHKVTLAEKAGPKMLRVLKAIAEYWSDEQKDTPIAPGALLTDEETIAEVVRKVVAEAEGLPHA